MFSFLLLDSGFDASDYDQFNMDFLYTIENSENGDELDLCSTKEAYARIGMKAIFLF